MPGPEGGFASLASTGHSAVRRFFPGGGRVLDVLFGLGTLAGVVMDITAQRRAAAPPPPDSTNEVLAEFWRGKVQELAGASAPAAPSVTVHNVTVAAAVPVQAVAIEPGPFVPAEPARAPSRYLMEEGAANLDEDCFSCATAHLAGVEGGLLRAAAEAERAGACGPECQKWLNFAVQEPAALWARDWTPERYRRSPEAERSVIDRFGPRIAELQRDMMAGPAADQRQALVNGTVMLKEAVRFAEGGDSLDHPEVVWRQQRAEADLVAAERLRVGALAPDASQDLRHLRQDVGNGLGSTADLIHAGNRGDSLAERVNGPAFAAMTPEQIRTLAGRAHQIKADFTAQRRAMAAPAQESIAAAIRAAGSPAA